MEHCAQIQQFEDRWAKLRFERENKMEAINALKNRYNTVVDICNLGHVEAEHLEAHIAKVRWKLARLEQELAAYTNIEQRGIIDFDGPSIVTLEGEIAVNIRESEEIAHAISYVNEQMTVALTSLNLIERMREINEVVVMMVRQIGMLMYDAYLDSFSR